MAVNIMNWGQYPQITINNISYYLIQNIDDNLCLAINVADTNTDDEAAGAVMPFYGILVQLDGITNV
jgi:hypothetical protein